MLLWAINPEAIGGDFEFARRIAEAQEREDPHQNADCFGLEIFQGPNIHCLRTGGVMSAEDLLHPTQHVYVDDSLVAQPVSKVNALDHGGGPFVAVDEGDCFEDVFDIAMAPVLPLESGDRSNVWDGSNVSEGRSNVMRESRHTAGAKGVDLRQQEQQAHDQGGEARTEEGHGWVGEN